MWGLVGCKTGTYALRRFEGTVGSNVPQVSSYDIDCQVVQKCSPCLERFMARLFYPTGEQREASAEKLVALRHGGTVGAEFLLPHNVASPATTTKWQRRRNQVEQETTQTTVDSAGFAAILVGKDRQ